MYTQDYDEAMPQATLKNDNWGGLFYTTPAELRGTAPFNPLRYCIWSNAIQPYIKSYQIYTCASAVDWSLSAAATNGPPPRISQIYNGDLHQYPQSGINAPAAVILLWNGWCKSGPVGYTLANPMLNCPDGTKGCIYQPTAAIGDPAACPTGNGATDNVHLYVGMPSTVTWVHGQGDNFAYCDGHVKWVALRGDPNGDPFGSHDANGDVIVGGSFGRWRDTCGHSWLFRPDFQP